MFKKKVVIIFYRHACGVGVADNYIVTGGYEPSEADSTLDTVAEYSQTGFVRYLPNMIQGRYQHACSYFTNDNEKTVYIFLFYTKDNITDYYNRP